MCYWVKIFIKVSTFPNIAFGYPFGLISDDLYNEDINLKRSFPSPLFWQYLINQAYSTFIIQVIIK